MANSIAHNIMTFQPSFIRSGWERSEDGNVYLANIPSEQKEYLQKGKIIKVTHPDGWILMVDERIKDRFPLENYTDTKIQAIARKYILMPDGEFKKSVSNYMRSKFSKEVSKFAIDLAAREIGSIESPASQEWNDIQLDKFRLTRRIVAYEQKYKTPFVESHLKEAGFVEEFGYMIRNRKTIGAEILKEMTIIFPFTLLSVGSIVLVYVILQVAKAALGLGHVVGSFVLNHLIKKFS